ncbi:MAG: 16S rRNA (adenine(1518)-N(6)/adenine(1519)-N(6))-dimethyltransferase RsmA [Cyclobacteriaceae bacterium]
MEKVKPKKHLGQHFLKDEGIARKIVEQLPVDDFEQIIEVGPGMGVLTKYLIEKFERKFVAFDIDQDSIDYLKKKYPAYQEQFVYQDFLSLDFSKELKGGIAVIGNFPYNVSSQLFFRIWENYKLIDYTVCMIQKEVADRIVSKEGNKVYGILSVLLQAYFDIEYNFSVPPQVFDPPPKVQSAVITLKRKKDIPDVDQRFLKRVVKSAFGKRRKTLRNALKDLNLTEFNFEEDLFSRRAEQLSVSEFFQLTNRLNNE